MYIKFIKPILDWALSLIAILVLLPIIVLIILIIYLSGQKPFFFQKRPGKNGKFFFILKFKTMNNKRDNEGNLLPDHKRLTMIGKILRKTSLDEIPQLINVVKGEMSLVGPRPLLPEYLSLYNDFQMRRHEVKPGITGWAQVNGRNALSWNEKFNYDIEYVENISFLMDLKIVGITLSKVIRRHGVNADKNITMEPFKGNMI